jgi:hypothetical protein
MKVSFLKRSTLILLLGFAFLGNEARAAQSAQVIVPVANIYLYPQAASKVISKINQGESLAVSNLPTEGFYKVRLANGDIGWISGNDVLAGGAASSSVSPTASARKKIIRKTPTEENVDPEEEDIPDAAQDKMRLIVGYGVQYLSYGGFTTYYTKTDGLNPGNHVSLEGQFRINAKTYWAIRLETVSANFVTDLDATHVQEINFKEIPVQVGIVWSPISSHKFRWGFGGYLGVTASTSILLSQKNTATGSVPHVEYDTKEFCGTLSTEISYGIGERVGLHAGLSYRYDQSGTVGATNVIADIPSFKINYSGVYATAGIEFRL